MGWRRSEEAASELLFGFSGPRTALLVMHYILLTVSGQLHWTCWSESCFTVTQNKKCCRGRGAGGGNTLKIQGDYVRCDVLNWKNAKSSLCKTFLIVLLQVMQFNLQLLLFLSRSVQFSRILILIVVYVIATNRLTQINKISHTWTTALLLNYLAYPLPLFECANSFFM